MGRALGLLTIACVESGDKLLERGLLGGAMRPRALDQARRQAEPRPDGEGIALPRPVVYHPECRLQPLAVELHRGVARPRMGGREAFEGLEVGGGRAEGAALAELLQHGLGQRGAVVGVRARAQLVQQYEGFRVHVLEHLAELLDEGGEGREVLRHALVVPDDGEELGEARQPGARLRGQVEAGLRHQREEAQRFQRHRLASRVGPRDDEQGSLGIEGEIYRDHGPTTMRLGVRPLGLGVGPALGKKQRVTRAAHVHHALIRHHGLRRLHAVGQLRAGEDEVRRGQPVDETLQLGQRRVHRVGERGQHLEDQRVLLPLHLDQLVIVLDHRLRLHEERRPALAAIVHDAPEPCLGAREHRQHVAAVAHGDIALLEEGVRARLLEERLQPLDQRPPLVP